ncbi:hypothetical protein EJ02DRAFT_359211 [Clathrospora elynae]|uniref:MARVEL domain-containing protein n=1 Tax=Clathrospora elynae TaxID=706981 RepID=A0A6A5S716_9PLEO|nr:hypothetical protein EJ02DRAFT_359211 [Clathrospora elynae]
MAFRSKDRVKPTHYPRLPFHSIRSAQLLSSLVVASIMFYFLSELSHEHYKLPWTFILLMAVSLFTLLALTTTITLHIFYGLNPLLNTALNSCLALLWAVSFSLLSWWTAGTLAHVCNVNNWDSDTGVSVCRLYKALFSFALFGLVATLGALGLDVRVQRSATRKGTFQQLDVLGGDGKSVGSVDERGYREGEGEANPNPTAARTRQRGGEGYALPEEQFEYNNTAYEGAAGEFGRQSVEERR